MELTGNPYIQPNDLVAEAEGGLLRITVVPAGDSAGDVLSIPGIAEEDKVVSVIESDGGDLADRTANLTSIKRGVKSLLETNLGAATNNDLRFVARRPGTDGDDITIEYRDPGGNNKSLSVDLVGAQALIGAADSELLLEVAVPGIGGNSYSVKVVEQVGASQAMSAQLAGKVVVITLGTDANGDPDDTKNVANLVAAAINALGAVTAVATGTGLDPLTAAEGPTSFTDGELPRILVKLATGVAGAITSIASAVMAAIKAHGAASKLIEVSNKTGNDGTGLVAALAETPLAGGADTPHITLDVDTSAKSLIVYWLDARV